MIIAERIHLFPSRTQKLSSPALKILGGKLPGKLGSRRFFLFLENVNDEGTAPSLAAGAVPFLVLRAVKHHASAAGGPSGPTDVVPPNEGTRFCGQ